MIEVNGTEPLDSDTLTLLATTGDDINDMRIRHPTWSPDGNWIFLVDSATPLSYAYLVPSDGAGVLLTLDVR